MNKLFIFLALFLSSHLMSHETSVTYEDFVKYQDPSFVLMSPDGTQVSYGLNVCMLETNKHVHQIYLQQISEKQAPPFLLEIDDILSTEWQKDGKALWILGISNGAYCIYSCSHSEARLITQSETPIQSLTISSSGDCVVYSEIFYTPEKIIQERKNKGYALEWSKDSRLSMLKKSYRHKEFEQFYKIDLKTLQKVELGLIEIDDPLLSADYDNWSTASTDRGAISPNGRYFALSRSEAGQVDLGEYPFTYKMYIYDSIEKRWIRPGGTNCLGAATAPYWLDNERLLYSLNSTSSENASSLQIYEVASDWNQPIEWTKCLPYIYNLKPAGGSHLFFASSEFSKKTKLINLNEKTVTPLSLPSEFLSKRFSNPPSFDQAMQKIAFVKENINSPPQIAIGNLQTKEIEVITNLNPWLMNKSLGHIEPFELTTEKGGHTNGYLLYPTNYQKGKKAPLIVATYFFSDTFFLSPLHHTTFPSQLLAEEGYFVLHLNLGAKNGFSQNSLGVDEQVRNSEGWHYLDVIEESVNDLDSKGLIDTTKLGLYGFSHGGFITNFLTTHSDKFKVAVCHEGADYTPGGYWTLGDNLWANIYQNTFGGPPWGKTLTNYLDYSPYYCIESLKAPTLFEFVEIGEITQNFEMYVPLKMMKRPTELVFYHGERHIFKQPLARIASMKRKVDWFNYWLFGKKDILDSTDEQQYKRWDEMRDKWDN